MRDNKISDKDREKWYRDYVSSKLSSSTSNQFDIDCRVGLKLPESTLKSDLADILKSFPLSLLNRYTDPAQLPPVILTDLRYLGLKSSIRDPLVETYISTLPPPPEGTGIPNDDNEDELQRQRTDRRRREAALEERERRVALEKQRQHGAMNLGRERLRNEEQEVEQAKHVGKEGLMRQLRESNTSD